MPQKWCVFLIFMVCSCNVREGYLVDTRMEKVFWRTLDEGNGLILFELDLVDFGSFEILDFIQSNGRFILAKDSRFVYLRGKVVEKANPDCFIKFNEFFYGDDVSIWYFNGTDLKLIRQIERETFSVLEENIAKDVDTVFFGDYFAIHPKDISSWKKIHGFLSKDKFGYYWGNNFVSFSELNPNSINWNFSNFAIGNEKVFWMGVVIKDINPKDFKIIDNYHGKNVDKIIEIHGNIDGTNVTVNGQKY